MTEPANTVTLSKPRLGLLERLLGPINHARLRRFRRVRRAWWSYWILSSLFVLSWFAEFLCNDRPLYLRFEGRSYFPIIRFYPEDEFLHNGIFNRPDYKELTKSATFRERADNRALWPPIPFGPGETMAPAELALDEEIHLEIRRVPRTASLDIRPDGTIRKAISGELFFQRPDRELEDKPLAQVWQAPAAIQQALADRFADKPCPAVTVTDRLGNLTVEISLAEHTPEGGPRKKLRLNLTEAAVGTKPFDVIFNPELKPIRGNVVEWQAIPEAEKTPMLELVKNRLTTAVPALQLPVHGENHLVRAFKEEVSFPFRPVKGHWLGLDESGRDVLVCIIYAFRISMFFGVLLVIFSETLGVFIGAVQGYFGGWVDIGIQRFTEIWSALPFLYIMILVGSLYGRGFFILLAIYTVFHWIGISYYMRAEFLRLRRQSFVEAAKVYGLPPHTIMARHILPNALVPLITFTPFSLVGAIGTLSGLDYLGFGLPPLTPSWGTLISQGQQYSHAWWLTLYPSLALFFTTLLCVFIGDGVRAAFDPKKFQRMQ